MASPELIIAKVSPQKYPGVRTTDPKKDGPASPILETLNHPTLKEDGFGEIVVDHGEYALIKGPALTPHHPLPNGNDAVFWIAKLSSENQQTLPWGEENNRSLAREPQLWKKIEDWMSQQREEDPTTRFSLMIGHPHPDQDQYEKASEGKVFAAGMQSQPPLHIHRTHPINRAELIPENNEPFTAESHTHLFLLQTFLTTGAHSLEQHRGALSAHNPNLRDYIQFFQLLGEELSVSRPFLAYESLAEAFALAVKIQETVKDVWFAQAIAMAEKNPTMALGALRISFKQSCVPNMTIFSPNESDRPTLGVDENVKAVIFPFSLTNPQSILDTVLLNRES